MNKEFEPKGALTEGEAQNLETFMATRDEADQMYDAFDVNATPIVPSLTDATNSAIRGRYWENTFTGMGMKQPVSGDLAVIKGAVAKGLIGGKDDTTSPEAVERAGVASEASPKAIKEIDIFLGNKSSERQKGKAVFIGAMDTQTRRAEREIARKWEM